MSRLAELEEEKQQYQEQLEIVSGQLRDDAGNTELHSLKAELEGAIAMFNEDIAEAKSKLAPAQKQSSHAAFVQSEAADQLESQSATNQTAAPAEEKEEALVNYQVNDTVLAKWLSGDKAFYPARITSVTGSSTAPIYTVKFKSYDNTETLRSKDIRPVSNKRKADAVSTSAPPSTAAPPAPGVVTSAGATTYPDAKKDAEQSKAADKPPKAKKIRAKKELEAGKTKWQEFSAKSKFGKSNKKESMFRTPEGVNGRVGFTGSGQAMRKDATRTRHVYKVNEDAD